MYKEKTNKNTATGNRVYTCKKHKRTAELGSEAWKRWNEPAEPEYV